MAIFLKQLFAATVLLFWSAAALAQEAVESVPEPEGADQAASIMDATAPVADENTTVASVPVIEVPASSDEETRAPSEPVTSGIQRLDAIVVTAQKRAENLQDVPVSVAAFTGETLDELGINDHSELTNLIPGFNLIPGIGHAITFLRGVGTDAFLAADPSVSFYIDGIYFPLAVSQYQGFGGIERLEVLKGPQGTLFGRNATGGAINIYTRKPDFDEFHGELVSSADSLGGQFHRLYANLPVADTFAVNVSAFYDIRDNGYRGTVGTPPHELVPPIAQGLRVKLRWQPLDNLDVTFTGFKDVIEGEQETLNVNAKPSQLGRLLGITPQEGRTGSVDFPLASKVQNSVYYANLEYQAPWFDVRLMGNDQTLHGDGQTDMDGSPRPYFGIHAGDEMIDAQSAELQFLSNGEFGPAWLEWIAGAYYFRDVQGFASIDFVVGGANLEDGTLGGFALPSALTGLLRSAAGGVAPGGPLHLVALIGIDSKSVFSQATITATDWLKLTLGARYQVEEHRVVKSTIGVTYADGSDTVLMDYSNRAQDSDGNPYPTTDVNKALSPKVALELRPFGKDIMFYLSWQKALKASTYNALSLYDAPDYVKPEEIAAWEVGAKMTFFDGAARLNLAAFDYDITNLQGLYVSVLTGGVANFQNAGRAHVRGFELDGYTALLPQWVEDFGLLMNASWLDARYLEFANASGFDDAGYFRDGTQDYSGNRVIRSPEWSGYMALSKSWHAGHGSLEAAIDTYASAEIFFEPSNREATRFDAYQLYGARLSYLHHPSSLRVTAAVKNLSDASYVTHFGFTDFGVFPGYGPPRNYSVQLIWNF